MERQRIEIPMPNGCRLVAESSIDPCYPGEIYIGILDQNNVWWQDLAIVRGKSIDDKRGIATYDGKTYEVMVYGNAMQEDYTDKYEIPLFKEGNT